MRRAPLLTLAMALAHTIDATALPPTQGAVWPAGPPRAGFAEAREPRTFEFPRDHGPHREFRQEWWYITGNLDAASDERFGFELTFFRFALAPPAVGVQPGTQPSAWRSRELLMAHFAVSDVARRRFRFSQKLSREALGLAGAQSGPGPLKVWIDDWTLSEDTPASSDAPVTRGIRWRLHAAQEEYAIDLTLEPLSEPVLNGDAGLSRKSADPGSASYYYSIPRLRVSGRLLRGGEALAVQGLAWLDREWGSGGLGARQSGWDWYGLQLSDGSALMFYALRDHDGRRDPYSAGTWVSATGEARPLGSAEVDIVATGSWRDHAGVRYPAGWRLRVRPLALEVTVRPVLADQQLETSPRYWEGAVDVSGQREGRSVGGRGYVELVGYAKER